jgi:glycosyltransferase involved in cell wall biosynthesis
MSGRPPEFSVIIPSYNRATFLDEAVASVRAQTFGDLECIVVDDGSPHPLEVVEDPRVRLLRRDTNGGCAAARNAGLRAARGRFVMFLDDDDLYTPDRLALAREAHADGAPVVVCWRRGANGRPRPEPPLEGDVSDVILDQMPPYLGQVTVARSVAPLFDERFAAVEDVDWWLRLASRAPFTTVPRIGCIVRQHDGPRPHYGTTARLEASHQLLDKHAAWFADHPAAAAFRWKRIALMAAQLGREADARSALWRSFRLRPQARTAWHLLRRAGHGHRRPGARKLGQR